MATTRQTPPRKPSPVFAPLSSGQHLLFPLILGCLFPLLATCLDITRQALPFSLESIMAVQQQPLHWLIDLVPVVMLLLLSQKKKSPARITTSTPRLHTSPGLAIPPGSDPSAPQQKAITTLQAELTSVKDQLEKTRVNEAALREMIENIPDALLALGVDGTVTGVNRGAEQMFGWTRQEMVGHPLSNLLTLASLPQMEAHLANILTNPSASPICEVEFVHSNGRGVWAEGCTSVIRNSNGETTGFHIIYRELSHRQQALDGSGKTSETTPRQEDTRSAAQSDPPVSSLFSFESTPSAALKVPEFLAPPDQKREEILSNEEQELAAVNLTFPTESETASQVTSSTTAQFTFTDEATTESQPSPTLPPQVIVDEVTLESEPSSAGPVQFAFTDETETPSQVEPPAQFTFDEAQATTEPLFSPSTLSPFAATEAAPEPSLDSEESVQFAFTDETETISQVTSSLPIRFSFADERETVSQVNPLSAEQFVFTDELQATAAPRLLSFGATQTLDSSPFNYSEALSYIGGDEVLLAELAAIFLQEYPQLLENLRTAVASSDVEALIYHAHALKGSVSNFVAADAENTARRLEQIGRDGDLTDAAKVLGDLETALTRLAPALSTLAVRVAA